MKEKKYLILDDLAKFFEASPATLRKRIKEGILVPHKKTKNGYLFLTSEIKKLDKRDIVRKFNLPVGYRRELSPPTPKELNLLKKYILDANRTKMAQKMGISRQRLHQKVTAIAYKEKYFQVINE